MASAHLPAPSLTAAERDDIVARLGGEDAYLSAFTSWLTSALEQAAATAAREAINEQIRDAVEQAKADLPASLDEVVAADTPE